jgi:DNA-binding PadR family transcriptional regulator
MREFLRGAVDLHLEAEVLLASRKVVEDGHSRRVYRITADGREALRRMRKALRELADGVLDD